MELYIDDEWKERVRASIPELPDERRKRYIDELGLPAYDAMVLTLTKEMSDFFEATISEGAEAKQASNWLMGEVSAYLNSAQKELEDTKLTPQGLAGMIKLIEKERFHLRLPKRYSKNLSKMGRRRKNRQRKGLVQISDEGALLKLVTEALDNNPQSIEDFKMEKTAQLVS